MWAAISRMGQALRKPARRLLAWAASLFVAYLLARAIRGDWGTGVAVLAVLTFGVVLACGLLIGGFLLGVATLQRLQSNQPVIGALPDVVRAAAVSADVIRGDDEPMPAPVVPDALGEDAELERYRAEIEAMASRAMENVKKITEGASPNG